MNRSGQLVALLVAVALASPALASQPGQPLDCSDWVFSLPGLSCVQETAAAGSVGKGADAVTDNDGAVWILRPVLLDGRGGWDVNIYRHELVRYINGSAEVVASITDRSAPLPEERVRGEYSYCGGNETYCGYQGVKLANSLFFDAVKGELIIYLHSFCWAGYPGACGPNEDIWSEDSRRCLRFSSRTRHRRLRLASARRRCPKVSAARITSTRTGAR